MIDRLKKIRLGFDVAPKHSGPGRYLIAIVEALDPEEFDVIVFGDSVLHDRWPHVSYLGKWPPAARAEAAGGVVPGDQRMVVSPSRSRWRIPVPHTLPLWTGFYRDARRLSQRIRSQNLDLFHAQNTGCEESAVAARHARVPRVLGTFHVDSTYDLIPKHSSMRYRLLESYSNRCLHRAIAVSEGTRQYWMRRTGIRENRIISIHNGINPDKVCRRISRSAARRKLGIPDDGRLILGSVGRLDVAKGFTHLIDAMAVLREQFPDILLVIAGSGPLEERLTAQVASHGLQNSVSLLGYCQDVESVYDALDMFVLSSICDAMPFALLEAMAHELPAAGTTVGGVPEVIVPGETGFLAPPRDAVALAESMRPLLGSAELRQRLGRAGRARVVRHFHEADMVRKTLNVYRRILGPKDCRSGVRG